MDFFKRKISTLAGIIVLLIITSALGYFIVYQINEITSIRTKAIKEVSNF